MLKTFQTNNKKNSEYVELSSAVIQKILDKT